MCVYVCFSPFTSKSIMPRRQFNLQRHPSIQWIYASAYWFSISIYIAIQFAQMIFNCIAVMDSFHFSTMRPIYTFFSYKFHLIVIQLGVLVLNGLLNQSFWSSFRFDIYLGVLTIDSFDCLEMKRIWIWLVKHTSFLSVGREAWKNYSAKNSWTFYIKLYNGKWVRYTSSNVKLYTIYTCMNEWAL